jgi:hypothetical protein
MQLVEIWLPFIVLLVSDIIIVVAVGDLMINVNAVIVLP